LGGEFWSKKAAIFTVQQREWRKKIPHAKTRRKEERSLTKIGCTANCAGQSFDAPGARGKTVGNG
jgi:hypothetical protein